MTGHQLSIVVLIRAWVDDGGVRGRVMVQHGDATETLTGTSVDDLCAVVCDALRRWERGRD
jgi:hypothetical protein